MYASSEGSDTYIYLNIYISHNYSPFSEHTPSFGLGNINMKSNKKATFPLKKEKKETKENLTQTSLEEEQTNLTISVREREKERKRE